MLWNKWFQLIDHEFGRREPGYHTGKKFQCHLERHELSTVHRCPTQWELDVFTPWHVFYGTWLTYKRG
jgi:hypothetical protein